MMTLTWAADVDLSGRCRSVRSQHGGATHSAASGTELDADAAGGVTEHSIAKSGAEWDWVLRAAPPIHLDGRTLAEVVATVTRDEGMTPVWSDSAARNAAAHPS